MILKVEVEEADPLELHHLYEKLYYLTKGGLYPIFLSGNFRFNSKMEVENPIFIKTKTSCSRRIVTKFELLLVNQHAAVLATL